MRVANLQANPLASFRRRVATGGPGGEIDETYMGGRRKSGRGRPMRGDTTLTPVVAIVQRKGNVLGKEVKDVSADTIHPMIQRHVIPQSVIYTDEFPLTRESPK
jgi:transposase-like protein